MKNCLLTVPFLSVALIGTVIQLGCSNQDNFKLIPEEIELETRTQESFPTNSAKIIAAMASNDVIVAVNGYPLTKEAFDTMVELKFKEILQMKNMNQIAADQRLDEFKRHCPNNFILQRLLVDNAYQLGVVTTNEVLGAIEDMLKKDADRINKSVRDYRKRFLGKDKYFLYERAVSYVMNKLIAKKIPPKATVNEEFTAAVRNQVKKDNFEASKTNELIRARLDGWRNQILSGKSDFLKVAKFLEGDAKGDGIWGTFEEQEMDDPEIAAAAFALKKGGISAVLEDDNGFHVVKVLEIMPAEKDANGAVVVREKRKLSHLYVEKIPLMLEESDVQLTADLKNQMQIQAINEYAAALMTNGCNRVEYPNGTKLF